MDSKRTYGEACAVANALDLVGDRWALLIVRELLFGPKRFSDLRAGLPAIAPNRLTQRLRELEEYGIVRRRTLGPPAASQVYELTVWGRSLEGVLVELARWGRQSPFRDLDDHVSVDSLMLALRTDFRPPSATDLHATYELRFGADHVAVRVMGAEIDISREEVAAPDVIVTTDVRTFVRVMTRAEPVLHAMQSGRLNLAGDPAAFERLLSALPRPTPADLL
ncbi:winged helix-turn-helix transcriptional regulator [Nocardia sp. CY41]|uniref:winged helix-turn-helix transcriptional regulator n=1 Tax=Nocardia sp. CY41 TaxID=2608686 RepID=UPI00135AD2B2|nr:winged helix-turn-helix transcriptional regulator [Nocardia sp. CY41]